MKRSSKSERLPAHNPWALTLLREIHREHLSGVLIAEAGLSVHLSFQEGALFLPSDYLPARRLADLLNAEPAASHPAGALPRKAQPEVKALLEHLADVLRQRDEEELKFVPRPEDPAGEPESTLDAGAGTMDDAVGPLPTACLIMRLALCGDETEDALRRRLGGVETRLRASAPSNELATAFWLDPATGFLLSRLEQPTGLDSLIRESRMESTEVLQRLCRLSAAGWIEQIVTPGHSSAPARNRTTHDKTANSRATSSRVAAQGGRHVGEPLGQRLLKRIEKELKVQPLGLPVAEHRKKVQDVLTRGPRLDHYKLLEIPLSANDVQVREAFERLARLVHPCHATRLGMPDQSSAMARLFEQGIEAYRVLSAPAKRREYNKLPGLTTAQAELEGEEKEQSLAAHYVDRARSMIAAENFHQAHELLNEAVRRHPRADYYSLLGEVQMRNPNWLRRASESLAEALRLDPRGQRIRLVEVHYALGEVFQEMERDEQATRHFQTVLELNPKHAAAKAALERLTRA